MQKIFFIFSLLFIFACSQKVIPVKPVPGQFGEPPTAKESSVQLPVSIPIQDINKFIETAVPQTIYAGKEKGTEKMKVNLLVGQVEKDYTWEVTYSVMKNGKMVFNVDKDGMIVFKIPLKIDALGCAGISLGTEIKKCGKSSPEIDLLIKTKISILPNWNIVSKTTIAYDLKKADLSIPFQLGDFPLFNVKLNIKEDLQKPIDGQLNTIAAQVDKYIAKYIADLKLKETAAKYWDEYSTSMNLSNDPPLFLNIQPRRVMMEDLKNNNNNLEANIGFGAILSVSSAPEKITKTPLPSIENSKLNPTSVLYLPIHYSYDSLEKVLEKQFKDTTFVGDGYKVTITGLDMFGAGKYVIVDVKYIAKVKGIFKKIKGDMYFKTLPAFDILTNTFYLEECELSSETNSLLTDKGLKWVANKSMSKEIMRLSRYCLDEDIKHYQKMLNDEIKSMKMGNIEVNGTIEKVDFEGFYVESDKINIYFRGKGKVKSKILL